MDITSVYTTAALAALKASNDDYLVNKTMYRELNTIRLKVLGQNNLGSSGTYVAHNYTYTYDASKADYFGTLLQKLSVMFPESFIYYTLNSVSTIDLPILTETSVLLMKPFFSNAYSASIVSVTNTIFISQIDVSIIIQNAFTVATIGTPINAKYIPLNVRKCWEIIGNTTITFGQYFGLINFVAVGGGQNSNTNNIFLSGNGGGVVYGSFNITPNYTITVTIGSSNMSTTIKGTDINIIANGGTVNGGSATGSKIVLSTVQNGGVGGTYQSIEGKDGPYISDLNIYVAGGGGYIDFYNSNSQSLNNFYYKFSIGKGGNGGGGNGGGGSNSDMQSYSLAINNTGGGGGVFFDANAPDDSYTGYGQGGSGVVYLYI